MLGTPLLNVSFYLTFCTSLLSPSTESSAAQAPSSYYCPISMDIMVEPVMIATGQTYDKDFIEKWLSQGHRTCPVTGQRLRHLELTPNFALRSAIQVILIFFFKFVFFQNTIKIVFLGVGDC